MKMKSQKMPKMKQPKMEKMEPVSAPVMPGHEIKGEPDKYEIDSWMKTLSDAHEIAGDEAKMKHVKKRAGRHMKAITSLSDLKKAYNDKFGSEADED